MGEREFEGDLERKPLAKFKDFELEREDERDLFLTVEEAVGHTYNHTFTHLHTHT